MQTEQLLFISRFQTAKCKNKLHKAILQEINIEDKLIEKTEIDLLVELLQATCEKYNAKYKKYPQARVGYFTNYLNEIFVFIQCENFQFLAWHLTPPLILELKKNQPNDQD